MFRGMVGQIRWITDQTRVEMAFDELLMSIVQSGATVGDVRYINKMVQQIKGLDTRIKYSKMPDHTMFITFFKYLLIFRRYI